MKTLLTIIMVIVIFMEELSDAIAAWKALYNYKAGRTNSWEDTKAELGLPPRSNVVVRCSGEGLSHSKMAEWLRSSIEECDVQLRATYGSCDNYSRGSLHNDWPESVP